MLGRSDCDLLGEAIQALTSRRTRAISYCDLMPFSMTQMTQSENQSLDIQRKRLRYRSWHRGTREMDLLIGSFADRYLAEFDGPQLARFEALLQESDPALYAWVSGASAPPDELRHDVMTLLLNHTYAAKTL